MLGCRRYRLQDHLVAGALLRYLKMVVCRLYIALHPAPCKNTRNSSWCSRGCQASPTNFEVMGRLSPTSRPLASFMPTCFYTKLAIYKGILRHSRRMEQSRSLPTPSCRQCHSSKRRCDKRLPTCSLCLRFVFLNFIDGVNVHKYQGKVSNAHTPGAGGFKLRSMMCHNPPIVPSFRRPASVLTLSIRRFLIDGELSYRESTTG